MTVELVNDAESVRRQRLLMQGFERAARMWDARADFYCQRNDAGRMQTALDQANLCRNVAERVRRRLEAAAMAAVPTPPIPPAVAPSDWTFLRPACETEGQAVDWMRTAYPDVWYRRAYDELAAIAKWWLFMRAALLMMLP